MTVGLAVAAVGMATGSLPIAAGAFLLTCVAAIVPAEIGLRECRRKGEAMPACGVTPEELAKCLQMEGIATDAGEGRYQEMVSRRALPTGRRVH